MKKKLILLLLSFVIFACGKSDPENTVPDNSQSEPEKQESITLGSGSSETPVLGSAAGRTTISFMASTAWTASVINTRASDWCSVSPTSGPAGTATITVTAKENATYDNRAASVTIQAGNASKTIRVEQKQKDALIASQSSYEVPQEGGEISLVAKSNVQFDHSVSQDASEWIKAVVTKGLKDSTLLFEMLPNDGTGKREGAIYLLSGNLKDTVKIYQAGEVASIVVSKDEYVLKPEGESFEVEVASNVNAAMTIEFPAGVEPWLAEDATRAVSTNKYIFTAVRNESYSPRSAMIIFASVADNVADTVFVTQAQKDAIVVAQNSYEIGEQGGALDFEVLANIDIDVVVPDSCSLWITRVQTRALDTTRLYFDIAPFTGKGSRKGAIVVSGADKSQVIEVIQTGAVDISSIPEDEIWYRTDDNGIVEISSDCFDMGIVSNTYVGGIGKLKFNGPVKQVYDFSVWPTDRLTGVYFPDCVEKFYISRQDNLKEVRIPKNMKATDTNPLSMCNKLEKLMGSNVSEDGRCLVIDNKIYAFAGAGLTTYDVPDGVVGIMRSAFAGFENLEQVNVPSTLKILDDGAFMGCTSLKSFTFPEGFEEAHAYAFFDCTGIEAFYGNSKFCTSDNKCFISPISEYYDGLLRESVILNLFAGGAGETSYTIPEGIGALNNYAFISNTLTSVTFPSTIYKVSASSFTQATALEAIYGHCTSSDHKAFVNGDIFVSLVVKKGVKNYHVPDDVVKIDYGAFEYSNELESITMGDQVTQIGGYAFASCPNLKSVTLSANLTHIGFGMYPGINPFSGSKNLEAIYMRAQLPPTASDLYYGSDYFNLADYPKLKLYVPEATAELYKRDFSWREFSSRIEGYQYQGLPELGFYVSKDFSADREPVTLQEATEGNGIDVVFMGDGYSDRQIADGTYRADMEKMYQYMFNIEPVKSFKHLFNVKYVNVVSPFEGLGHGNTGLGTYQVQGSRAVAGNDEACFSYAQEAFSDTEMDNALVIVVMNTDQFDAGTCYMYDPESGESDCGGGAAVAYFTKARDGIDGTEGTLQHEAIGHGLAKLSDEYYKEGTTIPQYVYEKEVMQQSKFGWYRNVDYFGGDPASVGWSKFLTDSRYANDNLGVFEGAATFESGVWKSSKYSMMCNNIAWFNAPSREAIYLRIHKLAYGPSWTYDFEKFVEYDAKNINTYPESAPTQALSARPASNRHHVAPVVTGKTWRQAGK